MDVDISTKNQISSPLQAVSRPTTYMMGRTRVTEFNYALPKGKHANLLGSFSYSPPSNKAGILKSRISSAKRQLQQLQRELKADGDNYRKKQALQCRIKYLESQLCAEVAAQGVVKVNVAELED